MFAIVLVYSNISAEVLIYFMLAMSLNFIMGYAKALSIHQAALFGVGAFSYAVFAGNGWSKDLIVNGLVAAAICIVLSVILALGAMRIAGDYFVVASFAFAFFAVNAMYNWTFVSGGYIGKFGLPSPSVFGVQINTTFSYLLVIGLAAAATMAFSLWLRKSPYGRLLRAMGESPSALQTAGFGVLRLKVGVFAISGAVAGVAGVLFASYIGAVDTSTFSISLGIIMVAMVIIGGTGSAVGSLLGAALITISQPLIAALPMNSTTTAAIQQLIFAMLLILVVALLPRGLVQLGDRPRRLIRKLISERQS